MKSTLKIVATLALCLIAIVLLWNPVRAQQTQIGATPVQQAQPFYTCNQTTSATGVANTAVTATLTPPAGQYVYLCSIYIAVAANAAVTGAAGPAPIFTTTNLPTNLVWWGTQETLTAGAARTVTDAVYPLLIKSATAGTAFTIVTSAGASTMNARINVTGFFAP